MEKSPEAAVLEEQLAALHAELAECHAQGVRAHKEMKTKRLEIVGAQRRLEVVTGKRNGGRPPGTFTATSKQARVLKVLVDDPDRTWTTVEIHDALGGELARHNISTILSNLCDYRRAQRISRAVYQAVKPGQEPQAYMKTYVIQKEVTATLAAAVEKCPEVIWNADAVLSRGIAPTPRYAYNALRSLWAQRLVRRVGRGAYVHRDNDAVTQRTAKPKRERLKLCYAR